MPTRLLPATVLFSLLCATSGAQVYRAARMNTERILQRLAAGIVERMRKNGIE